MRARRPAAAVPTLLAVAAALAASPTTANATEPPVALTASRTQSLVNAYRMLRAQAGRLEAAKVRELPENGLYAHVDVTDTDAPAGPVHTARLHVPAGFQGHPVDPNEMHVFYVEIGKAGAGPHAFYGPFDLSQQPPLGAEKRREILAAYQRLAASGAIERKRVADVPLETIYTRIDATPTAPAAAGSVVLLVPAGRLRAPEDPNRATSFYVERGKTATSPHGLFGPFALPRR